MRFQNNIRPIAVNENIKDQNPNILVTFAPSIDKHTGNKGFHHIIASAVLIFKEDLELIQNHFKNLYYYKDLSHLQNLVFIRVKKGFSVTYDTKPEVTVGKYADHLSTNPRVSVVTYSTDAFIEELLNSDIYTDFINKIQDKYNRTNIIFLFEDMEWSELVELFREGNTLISGGSNTRRHLLIRLN